MSAMSDAELDYLSVQNDEERPLGSVRFLLSQDETRRLIGAVREARAERDALRALVREQDGELHDGEHCGNVYGVSTVHWHVSNDPCSLTDEQASLLRSILDGAVVSAARIETYTLPAGSTSQVSLFPAAPLYRNDDPQTSVDAGEAHAPTGTYSPLQRRILDAFHSQTWASRLDGTDPAGFTVDEITRYLADAYVWEHPPHPPTIGKRLTELRQSGDLCPSTDTRLSDRGRAMTVWHLP